MQWLTETNGQQLAMQTQRFSTVERIWLLHIANRNKHHIDEQQKNATEEQAFFHFSPTTKKYVYETRQT